MKGIRIVMSWAALVASSGCAPMATTPAGRPAEPAAAARADTTGAATVAPGSTQAAGTAPAPAASRVDTLPSPDAERVLATIPEPLGGPPRASSSGGSVRMAPVAAPEAAYDTLRVGQSADSDGAVPVPAPTATLGSGAAVGVAPASTPPPAAASPPGASGAVSGGSGAAAGSAGATGAASGAGAAGASTGAASGAAQATPASGPCWRVQVAAPLDRAEAESKHAAAQSLLMVQMVIEELDGRYKVRTRDCMPREGADAIRKRAVDSGFDGSFLVSVPGVSKPAAPKPPASKSSGSRP